jgi:glycosyltransferase involved in cell wall biosynthesis
MNDTINKPLISIVSPVYRVEKMVPELVDRIRQNVTPITT